MLPVAWVTNPYWSFLLVFVVLQLPRDVETQAYHYSGLFHGDVTHDTDWRDHSDVLADRVRWEKHASDHVMVGRCSALEVRGVAIQSGETEEYGGVRHLPYGSNTDLRTRLELTQTRRESDLGEQREAVSEWSQDVEPVDHASRKSLAGVGRNRVRELSAQSEPDLGFGRGRDRESEQDGDGDGDGELLHGCILLVL
ncbi:hypothetical protein C0581_04645 [Candidatus Parcubacteria bacterium]|nr:MAG: hypothetical protein C0581_04645 [Candidatus Parcubacteria bacterium]